MTDTPAPERRPFEPAFPSGFEDWLEELWQELEQEQAQRLDLSATLEP